MKKKNFLKSQGIPPLPAPLPAAIPLLPGSCPAGSPSALQPAGAGLRCRLSESPWVGRNKTSPCRRAALPLPRAAGAGLERGWSGSGAGTGAAAGRARSRRRALRSPRQPLGVSEPLVSVPGTRPGNAKHGGKACPRDRFQSFQRDLESFSSSSSSSLYWKIFRLDLHLRRQLCSDGKVLSLKENQTDRNPCKQTQKLRL